MINGRIQLATLQINIKIMIVTSPQLLKEQEVDDDLNACVLNLQIT